MKLKGSRFESAWHQKGMQVVLNSIKENDFHDAFVLESGM
jgi:hypothetical protein